MAASTSTPNRFLARFFGSKPPSPAEVKANAATAAKKNPANARATPPPATGGRAPAHSKSWYETALKKILRVKELPSTPVAVVAVKTPAEIRAMTLAACELDQIPALQTLVQRFVQTMEKPNVTVEEVVASISKDSALSVRVLRMANSTEVHSEQPIDNLETAVQMLGVARVQKAADTILIMRTAAPAAGELDMRQLWVHSLATAAIAEKLAQQLRCSQGASIYLAGLLHDVGKIVLSMVVPDEFRTVLIASAQNRQPLATLEREQIGVDHSEAGVAFARQNKLAAITIEAISHHANPDQAPTHRLEVALVSLANSVSKANGLGFSGSEPAEEAAFATLPAWRVVETELGTMPDVAAIDATLKIFIPRLRTELTALLGDF
jgi:putative nucleotidyltransferase with HDIG domain